MSMSKGGRPIDPIWGHYVQKEINKKLIVECNNCKKVVSAKPYRMKEHWKKCNGGGSNFKSHPTVGLKIDHAELSCFSQVNLVPPAKKSREEKEPENERNVLEDRPITVTSQTSVKSFVMKTTAKEKDSLDVAIAKFFYGCNIPFLVSEHSTFQNMISLLRPGYKPPNRKQLAENLLDKVHTELKSEVEKKVSGKTVTLIQDGWSNIHNDPIIAHAIHTGTECIFINSVSTGSEKKTADYCAHLGTVAIKEVEQEYKCEVKALVTDNENKMESMRRKIKEEKPFLITYGCSSHILNLLGQDITPEPVLKHVLLVQKYFRNHHRQSAWLKEYPSSAMPQLPSNTRWNSQIDCFESFMKNRPYYLQIIEDHEDDIKEIAVVKIVNNIMIYKEVKYLLQMLKPIAVSLDKTQKHDCSIADACEIWLALFDDQNLMETHKCKVQNRFNAVITDYHMLAYLLHPKYMGSKLTYEQKEKARKLLSDINPNFLPYIISFEAKSTPFPETYFSKEVLENVLPSVWWSSLKPNTGENDDFSNFVTFASTIMTLPASNAGLERIFSNFSFIQNKLRNSLGSERLAKLVLCYGMLRGKSNLSLSGDFVLSIL